MFNYSKPESPLKKSLGYICLKPTILNIDSLVADTAVEIKGYFQLYDINIPYFASQPVPFTVDHTNIKFSQTNSSKVYFEVPEKKSGLKLLTVIIKIKDGYATPWALQLTPLFKENGQPEEYPQLLNTRFFYINKPFISKALDDAIHSQQETATQSVELNTTIEYIPETNQKFSYLWNNDGQSDLMIMPFPSKGFSQSPLITIHDITATLKVSGGKVYFKAFICKQANFQAPKGQEIIISDAGNKFSSEYVSPHFTGNKVNMYTEFISFLPFNEIEKSHIIFQFYHIDENGNEKLIKVAVCPLCELTSKTDLKYTLDLYDDPKKIPANAAQTITPQKRGGLELQITAPQLYFPPKQIAKAYIGQNNDIPDLNGIDPEVAKLSIIPLFARLARKLDQEMAENIVNFLNVFDVEARNLLREWIFNIFDPVAIIDGFSTIYPSSLKNLFEKVASIKEDKQLLEKLIPVVGLLLDIFAVCCADGRTKYEKSVFIDIISSLSKVVIVALHQGVDARVLNESLSYFLFNNIQIFTQAELSDIVYKHLRQLHLMEEELHNNTEVLALQFQFLSPLACSKHLLVAMGYNSAPLMNARGPYSPFSKLASIILLAVQNVFVGHDPDTFSLVAGFFARAISTIEDVPIELLNKIAFALFPLIELLSNNFESPMVMGNKRMQQALVPVVMFLIKNSDRKMLVTFFHSLSLSFQQHFISFLTLSARTVIDTLDVIKPTFENPAININLLELMCKHMFIFLSVIKDELSNCSKEVAELIQTLGCQYLPTESYPLVFSYCQQFAQNYPCERKLVNYFISLLVFNQHSARALGAALITMQFAEDFKRFKQVNISALSFSDSLTSILLENPIEIVDLSIALINTIKKLTPSDPQNKLLSEKVVDRMDAALKIVDVIKKQKTSHLALSERNKQLMMLADENMKYPNMRLKWLAEMVRINTEAGDVISALICQLHITALIAAVYEKNNRQDAIAITLSSTKSKNAPLPKPPGLHLSTTQPIRTANVAYDYERSRTFQEYKFMPSVQIETKVDTHQMMGDAEILLSDFSQPFLLKNLNKAIQLAEDAQMIYTLRSLSSMVLRLLYQTRSYKASYEICTKLANYLSSITTGSSIGVDVPLQFFLVERRKGGKKSQRVYCCRKSDSIHFFQDLRQREGIKTKQDFCTNHADCSGDGVCVVKLEVADDKVTDDEAPHCWDKFRSVVSINSLARKSAEELKKPIRYFNIVTANPLPYFHQGVDIKKIEVVETTVKEVTDRTINRAINSIKQLVADFNTYLSISMEHFKDEAYPLFGKDLTRFKEVLTCVLSNPNCAQDCVLLYKEKDPETAKLYLDQLTEQLRALILIYRRAVQEVIVEVDQVEKNAIEQRLQDCTEMINKFLEGQGVKLVTDNEVYSGFSDPMKEECPYESEY